MPIDAQPDTLKRLLDLQAEDTAIIRLNERKTSLPEAERLVEVTAQLMELDDDLAIAQKQMDEITREQNRLEGEIELLGIKTSKEEQRLFSGAVSNPKELSSLQAEVEMLKRRIATLEDQLLEVMLQKDQLTATVESIKGERGRAATESTELKQRVDSVTAEIDGALEEHTARRDGIAAEMPEELRTMYERIRDQKHGVGAAALDGHTCQGCHTELPAREVERLRAERGLQRCDNCRRILVIL